MVILTRWMILQLQLSNHKAQPHNAARHQFSLAYGLMQKKMVATSTQIYISYLHSRFAEQGTNRTQIRGSQKHGTTDLFF